MKHIGFFRIAGAAAVALSALAAIPETAGAQAARDRVREELRRTDDIIERAAEVVHEAIGGRPAVVLAEARRLQASARDVFLETDPGSLREAVLRTEQARRLALRAAEMTKAQRRLLDRVRQLIAESRDLVAKARETVAAAQSPESERLLEAAMNQLSRGQRAFHDHRFRESVRFTLFGRDLLLRAMRIADGERGLADAARIEDELNRTDEFLREAGEWIEDDAVARRQHDEAARLQEEARHQFRRDRLADARRLTLRAREVALEALRAGQDAPDRDEVTAVVERVNARIEEIRTWRVERGESDALRLLAEAVAHVDKAKEALGADDLKRALAEAQLASSLLGQLESRVP
jgi:hypothetical protein